MEKQKEIALIFLGLLMFVLFATTFLIIFGCAWTGGNIYQCDLSPSVSGLMFIISMFLFIVTIFLKKWFSIPISIGIFFVVVLVVGIIISVSGLDQKVSNTEFACDLMGDANKMCKTKLALKTGNLEICKDIDHHPDATEQCYAEAASEPKHKIYCDSLQYGDPCYSNIAKHTQDVKWCDFVKNQGAQKYCLSQIF